MSLVRILPAEYMDAVPSLNDFALRGNVIKLSPSILKDTVALS